MGTRILPIYRPRCLIKSQIRYTLNTMSRSSTSTIQGGMFPSTRTQPPILVYLGVTPILPDPAPHAVLQNPRSATAWADLKIRKTAVTTYKWSCRWERSRRRRCCCRVERACWHGRVWGWWAPYDQLTWTPQECVDRTPLRCYPHRANIITITTTVIIVIIITSSPLS